MSLQTFFDNFAHLTDAPNGVQKLRELILQLAAQGKLDTQNPDDKSASSLLEANKSKVEQLAKEKREALLERTRLQNELSAMIRAMTLNRKL